MLLNILIPCSQANTAKLTRKYFEMFRKGPRSLMDMWITESPTISNPGEEEQQDYRTIPIYPTLEEFHQDHRPFLRPNLTSQRYTNTHIYLDTHFRLLREDFVRPLREGVQQLLRNRMDTPLKAKHVDDIRVYFDTKLVVPKCTSTGLAYIVQFNIQPLQVSLWMFVTFRFLYAKTIIKIYITPLSYSSCAGRTPRGWSTVPWSACHVIILRASCLPQWPIGIPNTCRRDRSRSHLLKKADSSWPELRWGSKLCATLVDKDSMLADMWCCGLISGITKAKTEMYIELPLYFLYLAKIL